MYRETVWSILVITVTVFAAVAVARLLEAVDTIKKRRRERLARNG
jgi:hypothetical protein